MTILPIHRKVLVTISAFYMLILTKYFLSCVMDPGPMNRRDYTQSKAMLLKHCDGSGSAPEAERTVREQDEGVTH